MKNIFLFILCFAPLYVTQADPLKKIKANYTQLILGDNEAQQLLIQSLYQIPPEKLVSDQMVVELQQKYLPSKALVDSLLHTQTAQGAWSDIDYTDNRRSGWMPKKHIDKILLLTKLYRTVGSPYMNSPELATAIHRALGFWFEQKLVCPNWWYNQIGIPLTLGPALILFESELTDTERSEAIRVMSQARFGMTGQNKVWLAGNVLIRALLQNDLALVEAARDTIASEIVTGKIEGIKPDWSFHQHGPMQQFGNYGAAYLSGMSFWAAAFQGTSLSFPENQLAILHQLLMHGFRRIVWKGYMDINSLGRQFFHQAPIHKGYVVAFAAQSLASSDLARAKDYQKVITENITNPTAPNKLIGAYHFWNSDHSTYRTPNWMTSIKMESTRTVGAEVINGDNRQGYHLADGACYTYVSGDEYLNIYPCWDWRKIPGVTAYEGTGLVTWPKNRAGDKSDFVGAVTRPTDGMSAMIMHRNGLLTHKAWIYTPEFIFCMGAGITTDSSCVVTTAIDQRIQKGALEEVRRNKHSIRFHHDQTGYIIWSPNKVIATTANRTGSWHDVMSTYLASFTRTCDVMSIHLDHGVTPQGADYQYMILPATKAQHVRKFNTNVVHVLSNTTALQAVSLYDDAQFYLAAYKASEIKLARKLKLEMLTPALYSITQADDKLTVTVVDPTQKLSTISFKINKQLFKITLPIGDRKGCEASKTVAI